MCLLTTLYGDGEAEEVEQRLLPTTPQNVIASELSMLPTCSTHISAPEVLGSSIYTNNQGCTLHEHANIPL